MRVEGVGSRVWSVSFGACEARCGRWLIGNKTPVSLCGVWGAPAFASDQMMAVYAPEAARCIAVLPVRVGGVVSVCVCVCV